MTPTERTVLIAAAIALSFLLVSAAAGGYCSNTAQGSDPLMGIYIVQGVVGLIALAVLPFITLGAQHWFARFSIALLLLAAGGAIWFACIPMIEPCFRLRF